MKKLITITFFAFLLFSSGAKAQIVTGKLVDEQQQPIEYASIQLGPDYGVVSNAEGIFIVDLSKKGEVDKVIFSSVGFKTIAVAISDFKDGTYVMPIQINELDEVVISNVKLSPTELLTEVIKNAPKNYGNQTTKQTFFLRSSYNNKLIDNSFELVKSSLETKSTLKELNKELEEVAKKSKNKSSKDYTESYGFLYTEPKTSKLVVEKAVELKNRETSVTGDGMNQRLIDVIKKHLEPDATYKVNSGLFPVMDSLKINDSSKEKKTDVKTAGLKSSVASLSTSLNNFYTNEDLDFLTEFKRYTYTMEGYAPSDDETIYIIGFKPLKSSAKYSGKIYVNANDYAVVKLQYNMIDGKTESNVNLKFLLGVKMRQDRVKVDANYTKNEKGQYAVNFVKKQEGTYMYMNRSLKFTKNKVDKKEETKMLKVDLLAEIDTYATHELFVIDNEPITADAYKSITQKDKYDVNYISKYDPSIWKNYNILAPVDAIKNYN